MIICNNLIKNGIIIRYIITFISFYMLIININNKVLNKYIYLILPILLTVLDSLDNIFTIFYKYNDCTRLFYYQVYDKIYDSLSYLLLYLFLHLFFSADYILLLLIFYRIIGVILFSITKNKKWLIIFFDFVKEYLLYLFIFGKNYTYIYLFIFLKIFFEYYFHIIMESKIL